MVFREIADRAMPIPLQIVRSTMDLIEAQVDKPFKTTITFEPPCRLEYDIFLPGGDKQIGLVTYCLPLHQENRVLWRNSLAILLKNYIL